MLRETRRSPRPFAFPLGSGEERSSRHARDSRPHVGALAGFPVAQTSLVGRKAETASLLALLAHPQQRLVTVVGSGGVGKSRLAIATAERAAGTFTDGAAFVELAALSEPEQMPGAIASVLSVHGQPDRPILQSLTAALWDRSLLLVLDNLEHLIGPEIRSGINALLQKCPGVTVLTTSREPLRLSLEQRFHVAPMPVPADADSADTVARMDSVMLFLARARAVAPTISPGSEKLRIIGDICRRVDGLPLAIELAAAWMRVLSPAALLAQLDVQLPLLTGGPLDQPARFHTMRDAIAWSYDRLPAPEAALLRALSVFRGGFPIAAVERLAGDCATDPASSALQLVASLCDKHLVYRAGTIGDVQRFGMLETVRESAHEQLVAAGELPAVRTVHAAFCCDLAESAEPHDLGPQEPYWFQMYDAEASNLREAISWSLADDAETALRTLVALWGYLSWRHMAEGQRLLEAALALPQPESPILRGRALRSLCALACLAGDDATASAVAARITASDIDAIPDQWLAGELHWSCGLAAVFMGDFARAALEMDRMLQRCAQPGTDSERALLAYARSHRAVVAYLTDDLDLGDQLNARSVAELRELGGLSIPIIVLSDYAGWLMRQGQAPRALPLLQDALHIAGESHSPWLTLAPIAGLALADAMEEVPQRAARRLGAIATMVRRVDLAVPPNFQIALDQAEELATGALGQTAYIAEWENGQRDYQAVIEDAIAHAQHARKGEQSASILGEPGITRREAQVLDLIVAGCSDRDIAEKLFISERTASKHVGAILQKMSAVSRADAAVRAVRLGLV